MNSCATYPYTITNNSITITKEDGEPLTMFSDHKCFSDVKKAITKDDWDEVIRLMDPAAYMTSLGEGSVRVQDSEVYLLDEYDVEFKVPQDLGDTIQLYLSEGLPLLPIINFATKLNRNPSYRSVQQLFGFIRANNITLTEDGNFIAYKGIRDDFKDKYTGTFDNSIGSTVSVPRNSVDEDPARTCSHGLHVASYEYAHNVYAGPTDITVIVEVSPEHVVAVPVDYNEAKMRVCEYRVVGISEGKITSPLYQDKSKEETPERDCYCSDECDCDCEDEDCGCGCYGSDC